MYVVGENPGLLGRQSASFRQCRCLGKALARFSPFSGKRKRASLKFAHLIFVRSSVEPLGITRHRLGIASEKSDQVEAFVKAVGIQSAIETLFDNILCLIETV